MRGPFSARRTPSTSAHSAAVSGLRGSTWPSGGGSRTHSARPTVYTSSMSGKASFTSRPPPPLPYTTSSARPASSATRRSSAPRRYA